MKNSIKFSVSFLIFSFVAPLMIYLKIDKTVAVALFVLLFSVSILNFLSKKFRENFKNVLDKVSKILGENFSRFVLIIVYFLAIFPTKIIMLLLKRDRLQLRNQGGSGFWKNYNNEDTDYERQY